MLKMYLPVVLMPEFLILRILILSKIHVFEIFITDDSARDVFSVSAIERAKIH